MKQKYKDENEDVMQLLVNLLIKSLYGEQTREVMEEKFACKSEYWMKNKCDEKFKEYWKIKDGKNIVKMIDEAGSEDEVKKINTTPLRVGAFVLPNSKRLVEKFINAIDGFYINDVCYTDRDSLCIEKKHWDKLDKTGLVGKRLLQGKTIVRLEESFMDSF